jgi:hypothetical protein
MSKVSDLDREGLRDYMKNNGEIHRGNEDSESWKHAFKLYEKAQGVKVGMDCSRCWQKVSEWIRQ